MTLLSIIIYTAGFLTCLWAAFGLVLFLFFTNLYVAKGAGLGVKIMTTFVSCFMLPWFLICFGALPMAMITKKDMTPEDEEDIRQWMASTCNCPKCRARRGEL